MGPTATTQEQDGLPNGTQVGDTGVLTVEGGAARVTDTKKVEGLFLHIAEVTEGGLVRPGDRLTRLG